MLKAAREKAGLTQEELAYRLKCDRSTLSRYELKKTAPSDVIVQWSLECNAPELTFWYCKHNCAIGQMYSYKPLNSVDLTLPAILFVGIEEYSEALGAMRRFRKLMQNKDNIEELNEESIEEAEQLIQQFVHDVSRLSDIMKISLAKRGFDMAEGVKESDKKMKLKGYIKENSSSYVVA
jgi:transcriptional regulator with XRE-family HTH domain